MRKIKLLIGFIGTVFMSNAQSFMEDYVQAYNFYIKNDFNITYKMYATGHHKKQEEYAGEGLMVKSKTDYYTKSGDYETYMVNHTLTMIDHASQEIEYIKHYSDSKLSVISKTMLDSSMLEHVDSVAYKGVLNGNKIYRIYGYSSEYDILDMWLDEATHAVTRLVYIDSDDEDDVSEDMMYKRFTVQYSFNPTTENARYLSLKTIFIDQSKQILTSRFKAYKFHVGQL